MNRREQMVGEMWAFRAQAEHEARARFRWLAGSLGRDGYPQRLVSAATRAVDDEGRHREQCVEMAARFGVAATPRSRSLGRLGPQELSARERTIYAAIHMGCIVETMNVALLGETLRATDDQPTHVMTRAIMRDEVDHARIGWAVVTAGRGELGSVARWLPRMLEAAIGGLFEEGAAEGAKDAAPELGRFGLSKLREIFEITLQTVVLPGLRQAGVDVDGANRWARQLATSPRPALGPC